MTDRVLILVLMMSVLILVPHREASGQSGPLRINSDRQIELVIIDPLGRRTGFDPMTNQDFAEIPGANYGYEGMSDLDDPNGDNQTWCQFITSKRFPPINGNYVIRAIGATSGGFSLSCSGRRNAIYWGGVSIQGTTAPGRVLYYSLAYNQDPSVPVTLVQVPSSRQVSGGIFSTVENALSVHARPTVSFAIGNMLRDGAVTIRWLTSDGNTFGSVSSEYGFSKWDSVFASGIYSYQKFRTTKATSLKWSANAEYSLFTVQVRGNNIHGPFNLVNSIPGGEWFIDVNYSDKSDTSFYSPLVTK